MSEVDDIQETNSHNLPMELAGAKNGLLPSNSHWIIKKTNCEQIQQLAWFSKKSTALKVILELVWL